jgi:hypothetical protein
MKNILKYIFLGFITRKIKIKNSNMFYITRLTTYQGYKSYGGGEFTITCCCREKIKKGKKALKHDKVIIRLNPTNFKNAIRLSFYSDDYILKMLSTCLIH